MSADLHAALLAAISAREERAQRALDVDLSGRWAIQSQRSTPAELEAVADFWQAETSATAVLRQTARDRRVLERHRPYWFTAGGVHCETCGFRVEPELAYPCAELSDLAEAYGIELPAELPGDGS
jgi:hypothetical protein